MSQVNIQQILKNQGVFNQLWLDSNTDVLFQDQNGSVSYPYSHIDSVFNHVIDRPEIVSWHINVAIGTYPDSFSIPEGVTFVIEGPINGQCFLTGNISWKVTGDLFTGGLSAISFRNVTVGNITILDGATPATNSVLVGENSVFGSITSVGTSFITTSLLGTSTANFSVPSIVVAGRVTGNISVNGPIFANNVQFLPTCTTISSVSFFANGCNLFQPIICQDAKSQILSSIWNIPNPTITFIGTAGTISMDESSAASFIEQGGTIGNGQFLVATQRPTGWLSGGQIVRTGGLNVSVAGGIGYIFENDDVTMAVIWSGTNLTLPPNQALDIYVGNRRVPKFIVSGNAHKSHILLGTAFTSSTDVVFLSKDIVESTQISSNTDIYLRSVIGPIQSSGLLATIYVPPSLQLEVQDGYFFNGIFQHQATANSPIAFTYWYQDGSGGWITNQFQTIIDGYHYDNGSGTLAPLLSGQWKKDLLFVSTSDVGTEYHVVYGQTIFISQVQAETDGLPIPPSVLSSRALQCAGVIIDGYAPAIASVSDERIVIGKATGSTNNINALTASQHQTLRQLIHFLADGGPGDGFASGAYREITPIGAPFPTAVIWYVDSSKAQKIVEKHIIRTGVIPITITWNVYNVDGVTIAHSVTDNITYFNNVFESSRTRIIS